MSKTNKSKQIVDEHQTIVRFFVKDPKKEKNEKEIAKNIDVQNFVARKLAIQTEKTVEAQNISSIHQESDTSGRNCELEIELASEKLKNLKLIDDLKKSTALIRQMSAINLNKDLKIESLSKKLQSYTFESDPTEQNHSLFTEYSGVFTEDQLKKLRSVKTGKPADSTCILNCVRFLYPDASVLNNISFAGKMFKGQKKMKMNEENV